MWFLDMHMNGGEDEMQFIRNVNKVCSRGRNSSGDLKKGSSTTSPASSRSPTTKALLKSFLHDLSFWEEVPTSSTTSYHHHYGEGKQRGGKRRLYAKASSSLSGGRSGSSGRRSTSNTSNSSSFRHHDGSDQHHNNTSSSKPVWKTAVDPTTGRVYYYDAITRMTQWNKPQEVRDMEKRQRREKRKRDLEFFRCMEDNIQRSLQRGELIPGIPLVETKKEGPPLEPLPIMTSSGPASNATNARVRTISGMDEGLLAELSRDDGGNLSTTRRQQQYPQHHRLMGATSSSSGAASASSGIVALTTKPTITTTEKQRKRRPPLPAIPKIPKRANVSAQTSLELSPDETTASSKTPTTASTEPELAGEMILDEPIEPSRDLLSDLAATSTTGNIIATKSNRNTTTTSPPNASSSSGHTRRNTGGTIYMSSTMENPDIKSTMKCVCGVYRTHIIQTAERQSCRSPVSVANAGTSLDIDVFNDDYGMTTSSTTKRNKKQQQQRAVGMMKDNISSVGAIPPLSDVLDFYRGFFRRSQMEFDTIIVSLIYVERLVKCTNGQCPGPNNWRSILFACMVLASKVWDDLSMWNVDFSNVTANTAGLSVFTLARINQLELALLTCLNYDVRVSASEYAKYYFLIRTMLLRSGLVKEDGKPLCKTEDAFRRLETKTDIFQNSMLAKQQQKPGGQERRSKSFDASGLDMLFGGKKKKAGPVLQASVCLEQLVGTS